MEPAERLERFERALDDLLSMPPDCPIVVEGARDEAALRVLGVEAEILVLNRFAGMIALADRLRDAPKVIVLFDWDRKGGQFVQRLKELLGGPHRMELEVRRLFATSSLVKCVEDLPAARLNLTARADPKSMRP